MQQCISVINILLTNEVSAKCMQEQGMKWFWLVFGYILYVVTKRDRIPKQINALFIKA